MSSPLTSPNASRSPSLIPQQSKLRVPSLPDPITPLIQPYAYSSPTPTVDGPYILGVDEAGRGPVIGPLVYGVAYCAESHLEELEEMGFAGMYIREVGWQ